MSGTSRIPIDDAIRACFPAGHRVITAYPYGTSSWSRTARVVVRLPDSSVKDYFLRCMTASDDVKIQGEFISMQMLCDASPDVVPRPYAWGKFSDENNVAKCQVSSQVKSSQVKSSQVKSSQVKSSQVKSSLDSGWFSSWADCFGRLVTTFFAHEIDVNGKWPAYETAFKDLISKTIPRLLGRLQSEGRHIRPSLVHGNLSSDNVGVRQTDGMPVLFGACAIYAHHE